MRRLGILFLLTLDSLDGFGGLKFRYSGHLGRSIASSSSIAMDTSRLFLVKQSTECDCNCKDIGKNDFTGKSQSTHRRRLLLALSLLTSAYNVPTTTAPAFADSTASSSMGGVSIPKECQNGAIVAGK